MFNIFQKNKEVPYKSFKEIQPLTKILQQVNAFEAWAKKLTTEEFPKASMELKQEYSQHKKIDLLIPKSFALAREAALRTLGERMFDVQIIGGIVLHYGRIAEMKTGEGKTLTSTTSAYLNSLTGNPVHMVTVNDYLAKRDSEWMAPVFNYLGQSTGYIISNMPQEIKQEMYAKDIIYATNNELGFDYLRDNLLLDSEATCSRGYHYCIIDEIDSVLIDEARTPLIISGPAIDDTEKFKHSNNIVKFLVECEKEPNTDKYPDNSQLLVGDYKLDEKNKSISFSQTGTQKIESLLNQQKIIQGHIEDIENFEYIHYVTQALRAHKLFKKDVDYVINEGKVEIVDEFTGRVLKGRRYSDGLHQAIEAREGIRVERQNRTLASVTFQNFFRMYKKLSGMTGTAVTEEKEFTKIYGLDVVEIPTNKPIVRDDKEDKIYINEHAKNNAIIKEIIETNKKGQPLLIGTASIESSEKLSSLLKKNKITHHVLNAKNHENEAYIIAEAGKKRAVTIATNMAGRGTDIKLGGSLDFRIKERLQNVDCPDEVLQIREEEISKWQDDYRTVQSLGGLYVLGTERHESRRIDNQLRGRSGRQGDPGISQFFLSLDDQLMRLFGSGIQRMRSLMSKALDDDEPLSHSLISRTMERAQKNVEYRNFEIRKHLLNFDDVLNNQKNQIYEQRKIILKSDTLIERLQNNLQESIENLIQGTSQEEQISQVLLFIKNTLRYSKIIDPLTSVHEIIVLLKQDLYEKSELVGQELFNKIIRIEYLKLIDMKWQAHISQLDELRQAVQLRSYAQKNPLIEYKLESFQMFDTVIEDIAVGILRKFVGLQADNIHVQRRGSETQPLQRQHQQFSLFSPTKTQNALPATKLGTAPTIQRSVAKVGRNAPCPCGSGKKYKHCHGKNVNISELA